MQKQMKFTLLTASTLTALLINPTFAAKKPRLFPHGCREVGFHFENGKLILARIPDGQEETIYLVQNSAPYEVILKINTSSRYVPSYKKTLPAHHWAAFSRIDPRVPFTCQATEQGYAYSQEIDCQQIIKICNYNNAKFPAQNLGTYWLQKTSMNQRTVMRVAIKKGILLRW